MPDTDPVAASLEEIRTRSDFARAGFLVGVGAKDNSRRSAEDVPRLLAALDAVLALHQPEPGQHPDFCGADLREMPCPTTRAISAALLGDGGGHG